MKIIIIGAGDVGSFIAQMLTDKGHDITIIEQDESVINHFDEQINAKFINDNGATAKALRTAKIEDADYLLAMTTSDAVNLVCCSIAKALGAKATIARIHHQTYSDCDIFNYQLQFGADFLINPEALCAIQLAKAIRNPGRMAVETFARGEIEVQQIDVSASSKLIDIPLNQLSLGKNIRIGYITRDNEISIPNADTMIKAGDSVTLIGTPVGIFEIKPKFHPEEKHSLRRITLYGGTETAIMLAGILAPSRFSIRFIENDPGLCDTLSKQFPKASVIQGDATSLRLLEEEQIGDSDYFVACTKDDEDNIMTCIQAKRLGAEHVQLVINKPDYEPVLDNISKALGVELAVSPREATTNELLRYISIEPVLELACLPNGNTKIVKVNIPTDCPYANKSIREIPWPSPCVVMGLIHMYRAKVPTADDVILAGDKLLIIINDEHIPELAKLLL